MSEGNGKVLYPRSAYLSVRGDDGSPFWLCKTAEKVFSKRKEFKAQWLEKAQGRGGGGGGEDYVLDKGLNRVPRSSVIRKTTLNRVGRGIYRLGNREKKRNEREGNTDDGSGRKRRERRRERRSSNNDKKKKDPNGRLSPREGFPVYEKDPFFEERKKEDPFFVSTTNYSRLLHGAVMTKDLKFLKSLIKDTARVSDLMIRRSMANSLTPLTAALLNEDKEAVLLLSDPKVTSIPRANPPLQMIRVSNTGTYNYRSLGIRRIRHLQTSRGGREGNNALTKKDTDAEGDPLQPLFTSNRTSKDFIEFLISKKIFLFDSIEEYIPDVLIRGKVELAMYLIKESMAEPDLYDFTQLHLYALTAKSWDKKGVKEASVTKKGTGGVTPLHLSCINPSANVLKSLLSIVPDLWIQDRKRRSLVHYAAASKSMDTIQYLSTQSVNWELPDSEGYTPLMVASSCENIPAMEFIIKSLSKSNNFESKTGVGGVDRPLKNSWCPIHLAASDGNFESVKLLLKYNVRIDKPLNVKYGKVTALMLASGLGNIQMVKLLIKEGKSKVEQRDKFRRTALTHAVMNGSTNVASYILSLGADPNGIDSSGNSNLHYAAAYGWYHCCLILLEAGAFPDLANEWHLTPVAVAFLKGHRGLGEYLLRLPGVNANFQDDKGRTLLMSFLSTPRSEFDHSTYADIIYMIQDLKVNPLLLDANGKNALHYLTNKATWPLKERSHSFNEKVSEKNRSLNIVVNIFDYLLSQGCDPWDMDMSKTLPVSVLFTRMFIKKTMKKNYPLLNRFLDSMLLGISKKCLDIPYGSLDLLSQLAKNLSLLHIEEERPLLKKIINIYSSLESKRIIDLTKYRRANPSLLFDFCQTYSNFPSMDDSTFINQYPTLNDKSHDDFSPKDYELLWKSARELIKNFIKSFKPLLREPHVFKESKGEISAHILLMKAVNEPMRNESFAFNMLREFDKNVEAKDAFGKTPLIHVIEENNPLFLKNILKLNANVNYCYHNKNPAPFERISESEGIVYSSPLIDAIKKGSFETVKTLLNRGARIPCPGNLKYPIFMLSVIQSKDHRHDEDRFSIVKLVREYGARDDSSLHRRNPLHFSIEGSNDDFNINLELEAFLLQIGVDPFKQDDFLRIPLHYAFIKFDVSHIYSGDPIEVVTMLLNAMNGKDVDVPDEYGCTPLHYAAYAGSIVCCLLLIQHGADINRKDKYNNTPLSYAVLGKNEGTTITLLQKEANVNVFVNENTFLLQSKSDEKTNDQNRFRFLPDHYIAKEDTREPLMLLHKCLLNGWQGVSYLIIEKMESHGLSYKVALEISFRLNTSRFTKKLIVGQQDFSKLRGLVSEGRNLITLMAKFCNGNNEERLQEYNFKGLVEAGISLTNRDNYGCKALHYASVSNNTWLAKMLLTHSSVLDGINDVDGNGRTPLIAALWNFKYNRQRSITMIRLLLEMGANPNVLCYYKKLDIINSSTHPEADCLSYEGPVDGKLQTKTTPLIVAIVFKDTELINLLKANKANFNLVDDFGRSPLMISVKTNDINVVKCILSSEMYSPVQPLPPKRRKTLSPVLDMHIKDKDGFNASHHALFFNEPLEASHENCEIFQYLINSGIDYCDDKNSLKMSPAGMAEYLRLFKVYKLITKKELKISKNMNTSNNGLSDGCFCYNVLEDAQLMFDILIKIPMTKENNVNTKVQSKNEGHSDDEYQTDEEDQSDSDCGDDDESCKADSNCEDDDESCKDLTLNEEEKKQDDKPEGLNLSHGCIFKDYNVILSKIDVGKGYWGMYLFYRMQIWKDSSKDLYLLFTNWGRWGDVGNYQNTPFGSAELAIAEFEKIFKSKTRNLWDKRDNFINHPLKYRLMDLSIFVIRKRPIISFDLKTDTPSKLSKEVQAVLKNMANTSMYQQAYSNLNVDRDCIPFGQIGRANVLKAKAILKVIKDLIKKKEALEINDVKAQSKKEELSKVCEEIQEKSNEYYHIMPRKDMSSIRLIPIDSEYLFKYELNRVEYLSEFETAERLLLGAQYRKKDINPLDYLYNSLAFFLVPLEPDDPIVPYILKYMYRSKGAKNHTVDSIFKVSPKDTSKNIPDFKDSVPKLLWHGTKVENLLSILNSGLVVNPPYAERCGSSFGEGIYTADVYDKAFGYSYMSDGETYILLCKVALGRTQMYDSQKANVEIQSDHNSLQVSGQNTPLVKDDVYHKNGVCLPTGEISRTKNVAYTSYNEYIVPNSNQIMIDYIIRLKV